jgi:DNA-binding transcriptional regulator YiaG
MLTLSDMTPDEFKQARGVLGLSQMKMANALEVSYQTIQAWEQGRNPINKVVEMAVLHLLNTSGKNPIQSPR